MPGACTALHHPPMLTRATPSPTQTEKLSAALPCARSHECLRACFATPARRCCPALHCVLEVPGNIYKMLDTLPILLLTSPTALASICPLVNQMIVRGRQFNQMVSEYAKLGAWLMSL